MVPALKELIFLPYYLGSNSNSSFSIFSKSPMLHTFFFYSRTHQLLNKLVQEIMSLTYKELQNLQSLESHIESTIFFPSLLDLQLFSQPLYPIIALLVIHPYSYFPNNPSVDCPSMPRQSILESVSECMGTLVPAPSNLVRSLWKTSLGYLKARISRE